MNQQHRPDERIWCCFHPTELVVGICALCLNERLLRLASNQSHKTLTASPKKSPIALPKIFALSSLLNGLDIKPHKADDRDVYIRSSSTSPEDFISIKFEENGVSSWDRGTEKKPHDLQCDMFMNDSCGKAKNGKSVMERAKPRATLRWRRRIGHLFQVVRQKRSSKGNICHVGAKMEATEL